MRSVLAGAKNRLSVLFFRQFFRLLVGVTGAAEWACLAWVLYVATGRTFSAATHLGAVGAFYVFNRAVVGFGGGARARVMSNPFLRVYSGVAFVCLICSVFLLASGLLWLVLQGLGASAQALTGPQVLLPRSLDGAYRWFVSAGMAAIGLTMAYGYVFGQRQLTVTELGVPLRGWSSPTPLRIAQISDIHVGQNLTLAQLEEFVARVNALAPDLICVTGDIADSARADFETFFPVLGRLRARHGVFAILGNHDHYAGADRVAAELLCRTDFRVLRDEAVTLDLDRGRLHLIGLDDRGRDWARGLVSCSHLSRLVEEAPAGVPILLLSHRPDIFPQAADQGVALMLSGHTHGGQLAVPWFGGRRRNLAEFITRFDRGMHRRGESCLYVNCGLGVTGQRIRLLTPREISVIEIEAA
jgi:predicted MPP superfamily phosphohydrolase